MEGGPGEETFFQKGPSPGSFSRLQLAMNGEAVEAFFLLDLQGTEADETRPDKPETGDGGDGGDLHFGFKPTGLVGEHGGMDGAPQPCGQEHQPVRGRLPRPGAH